MPTSEEIKMIVKRANYIVYLYCFITILYRKGNLQIAVS